MHIILSGIDRNAVATISQTIEQALQQKKETVKIIHEPYLWKNHGLATTPPPGKRKTDDIDLYNINMHCQTPLFLQQPSKLHDFWISKTFPSFSPYFTTTLTQLIRGSGRLESIINTIETSKVVIITRNALDSVQSSLAEECFFGDEYHPSDRKRFLAEIGQHFDAKIDPKNLVCEQQWAILWWKYMTLAALQTYKKHPSQTKLLPYEAYLNAPKASMDSILAFLDLSSQPVLPENRDNKTIYHIPKQDWELFETHNTWYFSALEQAGNFGLDFSKAAQQIKSQFHNSIFIKSIQDEIQLNETAASVHKKQQLERNQNIQTTLKPDVDPSISQKLPPLTVSQASALFDVSKNRSQLNQPIKHQDLSSATVAVIITCFNNEKTIAEAIYSVLSQTRKPNTIIVADDHSTDNSLNIINEIAAQFDHVKLIRREKNVGVAANRDLAIRSVDADYISTLDGDDLYFPEKIELELRCIIGSEDRVAFSDIALINSSQHQILQTKGYHQLAKHEMLLAVTSRSIPVPRDMLFHKKLFIAASGFDVGMTIYEDWALKMRLIETASDQGWFYSGGIGTIYDRRSPGLSGKPALDHTYGQLLALARNHQMLIKYQGVIDAGIQTAFRFLEGDLKQQFNKSQERSDCSLLFEKRLSTFWQKATFKKNDPFKIAHIQNLVQ